MQTQPLAPEAIAELLAPYLGVSAIPVPPGIYDQLACYLELILKWNARINLTAIRNPEEIVRRHFGESLFAGLHLQETKSSSFEKRNSDSLLDLGSGAGFPGIPIQLLWPQLPVTLAESRTRKAAFLREAVRVLNLKSEVWAGRAEAMPPHRRFHTVTLRAVDEMDAAVAEAVRRAQQRIFILGTQDGSYPTLSDEFSRTNIRLPRSEDRVLLIANRAGM